MATLILTNTPTKAHNYANVAYCSFNDSPNFLVSGSYVLIGDAFVFTLAVNEIPRGHIGLNDVQRRNAKAFNGDSVSVSRFLPPPENFNLALLSVELELANKDGKDELVDAILFSKHIREYFLSHVMTTGQRVLLKYNEIGYIFTVNQVAVQGKEKTNRIERGMISADTHIIYEAPLSSGIQIFNQREPTNISKDKESGLVDLERCRLNGFINCGSRHDHTYRRIRLLTEKVKVSEGSPLVTCLLEGPRGSGKTAMAATIGIESDFPYVKIISDETMIELSEPAKCAQIVKIFEDAYKSPLSIIILDDVERLLEYVVTGPRFSDLIYRTFLVLLKRLPPKGKKLLVIGTTSGVKFLDSVGIRDAFALTYNVPTLKKEDAKKVLQRLNVFSSQDLDSAAEALNDMPLKKLYLAIEMAADGEKGEEKINILHFRDILRDMVQN
ncbi:hypothetical protein ABFS82_08G185500 [Erythranthe guttata]